MSTRSGDLDPGIVTYLGRSEHLSADEIEEVLSHRAGLIGISGASGDMRTLLDRERTDAASRLAVASYVYAVRKAIGALAAAVGGLDTLVFSGGIGEHASIVRARICEGLPFLGIRLDTSLNARHAPIISSATSLVVVRVIPTDEESMIARAAYAVLTSGGPS